MSRILSVCCHIPRADRAAGDRRYFALLEMLAREHQVDLFASLRHSDDAPYIQRLQDIGVRVIPNDIYGWLSAVVRARQYDVGLFEFWYTAAEHGPAFRAHQPWAALVIDSVDVHFAREEAGVALGLDDAETVATKRRGELAAYRHSDAVVVVTEEDRAVLGAAGLSNAIYTIPIIVPTRPRPVIERRAEVLFVGWFQHAPNPDGLLWFVRNIWPLVRSRVPTAVLTVVGGDPTAEILALHGQNGISVEGFVPETGPYLDRAAVSIAPLRYGGGMKGKVTEALAAGVPVVTTPPGAQGFGIVAGEHALIAESPTEFAAAVIWLLTHREEAARLGLAGQQLVASQCSPEVVAGHLEIMISDLVKNGRRTFPGFRWFGRAVYLRFRIALHALRRRLAIR